MSSTEAQKRANKKFREANKEKIKEYQARRYQETKAERAEYKKKYREEHKEELDRNNAKFREKTKVYTVAIPKDLAELFDKRLKEYGETPTGVLRRAIAVYLQKL